jgi:uncharacterized membrane protein HdeD (DUF308 family)
MSFGARDMRAAQGAWGWIFAFGAVLAILGVIALANVVDATLVTTTLIGILLAIGGLVQIIGGLLTGPTLTRRLIAAAIGVLYLALGLAIIADPFKGTIALTLLIGIGFIIEGALRIYAAFADDRPYRGLHVVLGAITILLGIWLWTGIPTSGVAIGFFVGFSLLLGGISWMVAAWALRSAVHEVGAAVE